MLVVLSQDFQLRREAAFTITTIIMGEEQEAALRPLRRRAPCLYGTLTRIEVPQRR